MRHGDKNRKFGRVRSQRRALLKSLIRSLVLHEGIDTTEAKAKEIRPHVEKLITLARRGTIASMRLVEARTSPEISRKLVKEIAPRYKDRKGGYTRIIKLPRRKQDASFMARIEFV